MSVPSSRGLRNGGSVRQSAARQRACAGKAFLQVEAAFLAAVDVGRVRPGFLALFVACAPKAGRMW